MTFMASSRRTLRLFPSTVGLPQLALAVGVLLPLVGCATGSAGSRGVMTRVAVDSAAAAELKREEAAGASTRRTLGVTPFRMLSADPKLSSLGYAIADLLVTDLSRSAQLQLVERSRLGDVLKEIDLGKGGRIDSATAPRVGQLLRARRLILGSIDTMPGGDIRVSARVADVESGMLEQALDARAAIGDILAAEKAVAFRLFDALGVTLTPAERTRIEARSGTSLASLNAYGRGVQAELAGDRRRALDEFERSFRIAPGFEAAGERAAQLKTLAQSGGNAPTLLPGVRPINAPEAGTIDRLNRPLDFITSLTRPSGGSTDPSFPSTVVTVLVTVRRP